MTSEIKQVPLLDLRRLAPDLKAELEDAFKRVLESGHFILGPEVDALEKECAAYLQVGHAVGVSSGTDALLIALMALGIGAGDEVVCPSYTFFATAGTIARPGARPVFVDSSPDTYNIEAAAIERALTPRTRAIMPVHLFGQCAEMDPILALAKDRHIPVIEDAAQALGSDYQGRRAGSMGELGCFSFFPSKNLGALGDAGLVTTNDAALAEKLRVLRAHGGKPKYHHSIVGGNFRIDALQAALLRPKLRRLDGWTAQRQKNAALYTELFTAAALGDRLGLPVVRQSRHIFNQYVIRLPGAGRRDKLQADLKQRGIGTEVYYPVPMHKQKCFSEIAGTQILPVSEAAAQETLAIPVFPEWTEAELRHVAATVIELVRA
ncbi:MAG: DegT/DnrJ/EryC1/StrS family aminotransferase [Deltaproteobacteria bacterium]|nr:DegT/DnrJ/EryC1/StrS family aminotransferase [Deltaproteobacteria bacterium]